MASRDTADCQGSPIISRHGGTVNGLRYSQCCSPGRPKTRIEQGYNPCYYGGMSKVTCKLQLTVHNALAHQSLLEFVNSVIRPRGKQSPLMTHEHATRQAELFMTQFPVIYPNEQVFRTALRGMAAYRLSWYDAHLWAYAEQYGIPEILSED